MLGGLAYCADWCNVFVGIMVVRNSVVEQLPSITRDDCNAVLSAHNCDLQSHLPAAPSCFL